MARWRIKGSGQVEGSSWANRSAVQPISISQAIFLEWSSAGQSILLGIQPEWC